MIELRQSLTRVLLALVAVGIIGGFVIHSGKANAQEPGNERPIQAPDSWIGKQVVTKYSAPLHIVDQEPIRDATFRVYTVHELKGGQLRLESESVSGWIDTTEVVLLDSAIEFYSREIRTKTNTAAAYHQRGLIWEFQGQKDKAIADYTEAIRLDPEFVWAYTNRGQAWTEKNEFDKAINDYTEAVRIDPEYFWAYLSRGVVWDKKNERDKAIADYTEAIRVDPQSAEAFNCRGLACSNKNKYDKAITDFTDAIRFDPRVAWVYRNRGFAWSQKTEYDKAIADYNEAIRIDPRFQFTFTLREHVRGLKYDLAIVQLSLAIQLNPQDAAAYAGRGAAFTLKHEFKNAIADYNEAIRIQPKSPGAYNGRAWIWATCPDEKYRDGTKAIESATRACAITDWMVAKYLETLAAACAELGDFGSAVKWQTKANERPDDPQGKSRGEARLKLYREMKPYRDSGAR